MSVRNNQDIRIASGKEEPGQTKPAGPSAPVPKTVERPRTSLASKISSSYNKLFILCMSVGLFLMLAFTAVFDYAGMAREAEPWLDRIRNAGRLDEMIDVVNSAQTQSFMLLDEDRNLLASNFDREQTVSFFPISFYKVDKRTYMSLSNKVDLPTGQRVYILALFDVTFNLNRLLLLGALGLLVFAVSLAVIYFWGNATTRKTFGVIDEMISKADSISSQNLNLRLTVSDASDELLEFALTFNKMMDRIEKAYEKQNQFVSDASHELRTPISVIQGYARMLERWGKDDKEILQESIAAINKEAVNMQDLVEKLLFIARNDRDTLLLVKERFDLSDMMEEMVKETRMLHTGHTIQSFIAPGLSIYGDHARIKQALRIFVDNALKYTPAGGTVTFRLEAEGGYAIAMVEDTGIGIPEKDLARIFDRFYRVDAARERHTGGHGLGLSIARIIILRHGGRIKIASREGEGTRFSIYLPMNDQQPAEE